jgi:hypothetical protein
MSKLVCVYSKSDKIRATRMCDVCGVPLCNSCGFVRGDFDYCNNCYEDYGSVIHVKEKSETADA